MQIRMLREIDAMFDGAPQTRKTLEVKEEMLQNLMEKYNDLRAEGKSEEAAFNIALGSVGDISDLLDELRQPIPKVATFPDEDPEGAYYESAAPGPAMDNFQRHNRAMIVTVAVILYILSPVAVIVFGGSMGLILLFVMIAAATGLLIYNGMTSDKPGKEGTRNVQSAAEQKTKMSKQQKKFFASLSSALWLIATAIYFMVSFGTGAWYITWIIFLIAAAANNVLKAFLDMYRE